MHYIASWNRHLTVLCYDDIPPAWQAGWEMLGNVIRERFSPHDDCAFGCQVLEAFEV
jgi:hypothetical protein